MRLFLKLVAGIAALVVLLLVALAIVINTIDPRTLLAPIEAQLERATGRDVSLGSDARIDLSLSPTLQLSDVTLGNAPWGSAKEMLRAKRVEAQVALLPLLSRRVDIVRFTLVEPTILLETDASGQGNWTFGNAASPSRPADPVGDAAGAFGLGEFAVEKGDVRWRDGRTGEVTAIRIDRLYLRARDPDKPVVAQFTGAVGELPVALEGHFGPLAALRAKQWPWPVSVNGEVGGRRTEITTKVRETAEGLEASDLSVVVGGSKLGGSLVYAARPKRPFLRFALRADDVTPSDLTLAAGGAAGAASAATGNVPAVPARGAARDNRVFDAERLPLASLRTLDAQGEIAIGRLLLAQGRTLSQVRATIDLADGRLELRDVSTNALGGTVQGRILVDARNEASPSVALQVNAKQLDLAAVMATAGVPRDVKGGKTDVRLDVAGRGASAREIVSTLNGTVTAGVGAATWVSKDTGLPPELSQLANAFNPARSSGSVTDLRCAAMRLPFASGVARFDRAIGLETDRLGAAASGTIDLRNETLELLVHPRIKDRAGLDLASIAGAVKVAGPLRAPTVAFNPVGSITAAADIAALARGGRSALLGALAPTAPSGPSECAVALGEAKPGASAPARREAAPAARNDPARDVERALGRIFGR